MIFHPFDLYYFIIDGLLQCSSFFRKIVWYAIRRKRWHLAENDEGKVVLYYVTYVIWSFK